MKLLMLDMTDISGIGRNFAGMIIVNSLSQNATQSVVGNLHSQPGALQQKMSRIIGRMRVAVHVDDGMSHFCT